MGKIVMNIKKIVKNFIGYGFLIIQLVLLFLFIQLGGVWFWIWLSFNLIIGFYWIYNNWINIVLISEYIYYNMTGKQLPKIKVKKKDIHEWFYKK